MQLRPSRRGRPPTFTPETRARFADSIRRHGATDAQKRAGISVSLGTLLKIAREHGVKLAKGRRPRHVASGHLESERN